MNARPRRNIIGLHYAGWPRVAGVHNALIVSDWSSLRLVYASTLPYASVTDVIPPFCRAGVSIMPTKILGRVTERTSTAINCFFLQYDASIPSHQPYRHAQHVDRVALPNRKIGLQNARGTHVAGVRNAQVLMEFDCTVLVASLTYVDAFPGQTDTFLI